MVKLQYNLEEIPDAPPSLPPGIYKVVLKSCVKKKSKKDKDMFEWTWKVKGGNHDGESIKTWTSLQKNALSGLKEHLTAFGLKGKVDSNTDKLLGQYVGVLVENRKGQNRSGEEIETTGVTMVMSLERYKAMKEKMDAKGISTSKEPSKKGKAKKDEEEEPEEDEEEEEDDDEDDEE